MSQLQLSFHNTIKAKGKDLETANAKCNDQEERILDIFKAFKTHGTPFDIERVYNAVYDPIPITSIRRAMTNLERAGKLEKTGQMKMERYGKPNHLWRAKSN